MVSIQVQHLLERAIDSAIKVHVVLLFTDQPFEGCAFRVAECLFGDIISVDEALRELAEDGVLESVTMWVSPSTATGPAPSTKLPSTRSGRATMTRSGGKRSTRFCATWLATQPISVHIAAPLVGAPGRASEHSIGEGA